MEEEIDVPEWIRIVEKLKNRKQNKEARSNLFQ